MSSWTFIYLEEDLKTPGIIFSSYDFEHSKKEATL
jgi:hypothetical protein